MNTETASALIYIALFPSIIAYLSWNYGIKKIGAAIGGQFIHLMPLFGTGMAVIFLHEAIALYHIVGAALIGGGLWMSIGSRAQD